MVNFRTSILITLIVVTTAFASAVVTANSYPSENNFENKPDLVEILHRKFQIAYRKKLARKFPLSLVELEQNCEAVTQCENGVTLSCRVQAQHASCYSDSVGAICLFEDTKGRIIGSNANC